MRSSSKTSSNNSTKVLLFDLGGVLVELGDNPLPKHWLAVDQVFTLAEWFKSECAHQFEKGEISASDFAQQLQDQLSLSASLEEICREFKQWPRGMYAGAPELLSSLRQQHTLAVLTNTNELHWPRIVDEFMLLDHVSSVFASHILKLAKPDPLIYQAVLEMLKVEPSEVIFFDDNQANIKAAQELGIESYLVDGIKELQQKVIELGLLESDLKA